MIAITPFREKFIRESVTFQIEFFISRCIIYNDRALIVMCLGTALIAWYYCKKSALVRSFFDPEKKKISEKEYDIMVVITPHNTR